MGVWVGVVLWKEARARSRLSHWEFHHLLLHPKERKKKKKKKPKATKPHEIYRHLLPLSEKAAACVCVCVCVYECVSVCRWMDG